MTLHADVLFTPHAPMEAGCGTLHLGRHCPQASAVRLADVVADRQAQPQPVRLRSREGLEYIAALIRFQSGAAIAHRFSIAFAFGAVSSRHRHDPALAAGNPAPSQMRSAAGSP